MKVVLAGAFGNLGADILKCLCRDGHEVVAATLRKQLLKVVKESIRLLRLMQQIPKR